MRVTLLSEIFLSHELEGLEQLLVDELVSLLFHDGLNYVVSDGVLVLLAHYKHIFFFLVDVHSRRNVNDGVVPVIVDAILELNRRLLSHVDLLIF